MTNLDIVKDAIDTLERQEITFAIAAKLADLYIVYDHMVNGSQDRIRQVIYEEAESSVEKSEFMQAVEVAGSDNAWKVMDDLMTTLQTINKRLYDGVIRQLTGE